MAKTAELTDTIMMYSETSNAQSTAGTLSRMMSGRGPYVFRSGTRSWTNDSDVSVSTKLRNITKAAEKSKTPTYCMLK